MKPNSFVYQFRQKPTQLLILDVIYGCIPLWKNNKLHVTFFWSDFKIKKKKRITMPPKSSVSGSIKKVTLTTKKTKTAIGVSGTTEINLILQSDVQMAR